jgi:two-component system, LytTR family, response regulator
MIRTVIVDDDLPGRARLRELLASEAEVEVIGEFENGSRASFAIQELNPDLVFLEVAAPRFEAFQILESDDVGRIPAVVLMANTDRYAARAFEVQAVDYVVKPFGSERLQRTLGHVRERLVWRRPIAQIELLTSLLKETPTPEDRYLTRLLVKEGGRLFFLQTADIDWVEACGNVVRLHVGTRAHSLRTRMSLIESRLDPERFIRIHRSTIVNIDRIREIRARLHGDYFVILGDAQTLSMSAGYLDKLDELRRPQCVEEALKTARRRTAVDAQPRH